MSINGLKDVYIDQLQDLYSANQQSAAVTAKLAEASSDPELKEALLRGVAGIEDGMKQITSILANHDAATGKEFCKGMEGMVKEAHAHALETEFSDEDAKDATIITQYQRMAHYAIAGYGCLVAFANRLELGEEGAVIQKCLDACYDGDRKLSKLATGGINAAAV